jgi:hypothetical protein
MPVPSERSEWLEPVVRRRCLGQLVGDCGTMAEPPRPCNAPEVSLMLWLTDATSMLAPI